MAHAPLAGLRQIARVLKANGTGGEVVLGFSNGSGPQEINAEEPVFIVFDGLPVPFFICSCTHRGSKAVVRFNGVRSLVDAEELVGREVLASPDSLVEEKGGGGDLDALTGWKVIDGRGRFVGKITGFEDIPGNPCLYVAAGDMEIMLPFHEDLILSLDSEAGLLEMELPEGLT